MDKENIKRGSFLKEVRTANLLSEEELADLLGVEASDITVWETGIKFPEDNETLDDLSRVLNVSKKELLNGEFKKDKAIERPIEVEYKELKAEDNSIMSNSAKNVILVVLSCMVLFILVVTIASVTKSNKVYSPAPTERIEVSDEREPVYYEPHRSNEYIIHNTQVLSANDSSNYDGSNLTKYGFVSAGNNKYVKNTGKYKIEYYNSVFHLTVYRKFGNLYIERDARSNLLKYTDSNRAKTVTVEVYSPSGEVDCDDYMCIYNNDYYKYLNLLVYAVRG